MFKVLPWLFCFGCVSSGAKWSKTEISLEIAYSATILADWHQTQFITGKCLETNPIIGACGQNVAPNIYMPFSLFLHIAAVHLLPKKWRIPFQAVTAGWEGAIVYSNRVDGIKIFSN